MPTANVYSFLNFQAVLTGPSGVVSLSSGAGNAAEGVTVDPLTERDVLTIGADGTPMHSLVANQAARLTVRLLKTAPANLVLSTMFNLQGISASLWGQNTISMTDTARGDVVLCQQVAFARLPTLTYAIEGGVQEWPFLAGIVTYQLGAGV